MIYSVSPGTGVQEILSESAVRLIVSFGYLSTLSGALIHCIRAGVVVVPVMSVPSSRRIFRS